MPPWREGRVEGGIKLSKTVVELMKLGLANEIVGVMLRHRGGGPAGEFVLGGHVLLCLGCLERGKGLVTIYGRNIDGDEG